MYIRPQPNVLKVCLRICVQEAILHAFQCTKLLVDTSPAHGGRPCLYICFVNWLHVLSGSILKCNCMSQKTHDSLHSQPPEKYKHAGVSGGHEMPLHTKTGLWNSNVSGMLLTALGISDFEICVSRICNHIHRLCSSSPCSLQANGSEESQVRSYWDSGFDKHKSQPDMRQGKSFRNEIPFFRK